jgi:hypothetical protein
MSVEDGSNVSNEKPSMPLFVKLNIRSRVTYGKPNSGCIYTRYIQRHQVRTVCIKLID